MIYRVLSNPCLRFGWLVFLLGLSGCKTVDKMALQSTVGIAKAGFASFLEEEDTILAREAVAGNVKIIDGLLIQDGKNPELALLGARAFFSYGFGYVEPENEWRAGRLYQRGLRAGAEPLGGENIFLEMDKDSFQALLDKTIKDQYELWFWSTLNFASWMNLNKDDMDALNNRYKVELIGLALKRVAPEYYFGGGDLLLGLYYASHPKALGGTPEKAQNYFEEALQYAKGQFLMTSYLYARYYAVAMQDDALFDTLVENILSTDAAALWEQQLVNLLAQERTQELKANKEDLFI